jgi:hypothetical protein
MSHKISAKCFNHAQNSEMKEALFEEIRHISIHKIKNRRMNPQKIADEAN